MNLKNFERKDDNFVDFFTNKKIFKLKKVETVLMFFMCQK